MTAPAPPITVHIQPSHIGLLAHCPTCNRSGTIDNVTDDHRVIIRHSAIHWCVIAPGNVHLVELYPPKGVG